MFAEGTGFIFKVRDGQVGIISTTPCGEIPVIVFGSVEAFAKFLYQAVKFYNELNPQVPEVFKKAFNESP